MARGATFLKSKPGVGKQDTHTDFDFMDIVPPPGFRRGKPFSIWIALSDDSCLWLAGQLETYKAGDVVIFAGDCSHSGAPNTGKECTYRLFSYVPTRDFEVPWDFHGCTAKVKHAAKEVTEPKEVARLHVDTNALSVKVKWDEYCKYLFDRKTCKFYSFTIPLWIEGPSGGSNFLALRLTGSAESLDPLSLDTLESLSTTIILRCSPSSLIGIRFAALCTLSQ
jgi:hypothetical protein